MSNSTTNLQTGDDLAQAALNQANEAVQDSDADEVSRSNQIAETLTHLQSVIEGNAHQLQQLRSELKEKRESLRGMFESDAKLVETETQTKKLTEELRQEKARVQSSPTTLALRTQLADLREQQKEIEETLNNHLLNYYQLTNSTSFDTSDGDQWDFKIIARLKNH